MSKDYAEHRENRENLIDIAGLFDDLVKVAFQLKFKFLITIIVCGHEPPHPHRASAGKILS